MLLDVLNFHACLPSFMRYGVYIHSSTKSTNIQEAVIMMGVDKNFFHTQNIEGNL